MKVKVAKPTEDFASLTLRMAGARIWQPAWSPDGRRLAAAGNDSALRVWDVRTGRLQLEIPHDQYVRIPAWSPDGGRIFAGSIETTASIWNATTGRVLTELVDPDGPVQIGHFSPDGRRIVTTGVC